MERSIKFGGQLDWRFLATNTRSSTLSLKVEQPHECRWLRAVAVIARKKPKRSPTRQKILEVREEQFDSPAEREGYGDIDSLRLGKMPFKMRKKRFVSPSVNELRARLVRYRQEVAAMLGDE